MTQKTILITGANRGIGLAACKDLLANNHFVIATSRSQEGLEILETELSGFKDKVLLPIRCE